MGVCPFSLQFYFAFMLAMTTLIILDGWQTQHCFTVYTSRTSPFPKYIHNLTRRHNTFIHIRRDAVTGSFVIVHLIMRLKWPHKAHTLMAIQSLQFSLTDVRSIRTIFFEITLDFTWMYTQPAKAIDENVTPLLLLLQNSQTEKKVRPGKIVCLKAANTLRGHEYIFIYHRNEGWHRAPSPKPYIRDRTIGWNSSQP